MCGIAGFVDLEGRLAAPQVLLAMSRALSHRGPDDEGYALVDAATRSVAALAGPDSHPEIRAQMPGLAQYQGKGGTAIGLAHRRFSIIDLSPAAHQPFFDASQSCCIAFNGEIYNYVEIREELRAQGVRFRTRSDTEVFLEAYKCWGTACFARLNGFWAAAIYDGVAGKLVLSRDRIGKKPLYWTRKGPRIFFASEIKALLQVREVGQAARVNEDAAYLWLTQDIKDFHNTTLYEGIQSLPAGSWAVVNAEFPSNAVRFWQVPRERLRESDISAAEAQQTLLSLLGDAVRIRLRADVTVGLELSGGMDSSTLAALVAQQGGKIAAYTARFPDKEANEVGYAQSIIKRFGFEHHLIDVPFPNFWARIRPFTWLEEEPYHAPNLYTNQAVWSGMRGLGVRVSLNGAAGDESFAGYSGYYDFAQIDNLRALRLGAFLKNAIHYSERSVPSALFGPARAWAGLARRRWQRNEDFCPPGALRLAPRPVIPYPRSLSDSLYQHMTATLMPYWLRSGDQGYMGVPLEVRAPFLDFRVVEFAFRLPTTYLIRDGWHKWILRRAMEELLPADVVWRRQKMGFPFPFERFYRESSPIIDLILARASNPYLNMGRAAGFRNRWTFISFILWYEYFINHNESLFEDIQVMAQARAVTDSGYKPAYLHGHQSGAGA